MLLPWASLAHFGLAWLVVRATGSSATFGPARCLSSAHSLALLFIIYHQRLGLFLLSLGSALLRPLSVCLEGTPELCSALLPFWLALRCNVDRCTVSWCRGVVVSRCSHGVFGVVLCAANAQVAVVPYHVLSFRHFHWVVARPFLLFNRVYNNIMLRAGALML